MKKERQNLIDQWCSHRRKNWRLKIFVFMSYNFIYNIINGLLSYAPSLFRYCFFKFTLKHLGKSPLIDSYCYFRYPWTISVGDYVSFNRGVKIYNSSMRTTRVSIGDHVRIGPEVKILGGTHDYSRLSLPDMGDDVIIQDYVWIGCGAIIMPGVRIGTGAVIGAGSIVTKDIPPWTIAVGNPARVIKNRLIHNNQEPSLSRSNVPK